MSSSKFSRLKSSLRYFGNLTSGGGFGRMHRSDAEAGESPFSKKKLVAEDGSILRWGELNSVLKV